MKTKTSTIQTLLFVFFCFVLTASLFAQTPNATPKTGKKNTPEVPEGNSRKLTEKTRQTLKKWSAKQKLPISASKTFSQQEVASLLTNHGRFLQSRSLSKIKNEQTALPGSHMMIPVVRRKVRSPNPIINGGGQRVLGTPLTRLYVDGIATTGANDGSTWEDAFLELADALRFAEGNPEVEEIWVAYGIYKPKHRASDGSAANPADRDNAFKLVPNVKIYGGFYGNETAVSERDLRNSDYVDVFGQDDGDAYATILSGDFEGNDTPDFASHTENAYHVVLSLGEVGSALLDGVTITGGYANTETGITVGAQNVNRGSGAGMVIISSAPMLNNIFFRQNKTLGNGGAILAYSSPFILTNAIIAYNSSVTGGVFLENSSPFITNATITGNTADDGGGIATYGSGAPQIRNTIIWGNTTNNVMVDGAIPSYYNSLIEGSGGSGVDWVAAFGMDEDNNLDEDPQFFDATYGMYGLKPSSPAINAGSNGFFDPVETPDLGGIDTDIRGTLRITKMQVDMGAVESLYDVLTTVLEPTDGRLYVIKGGTGDETGQSWEHAAPEVADALVAARLNPDITEIWVAGGTYRPLYRPDDLSKPDPVSRYNAFVLVEGVKVYGGFAGDEESLDERELSIKENASILSADFNGDDEFDFNEGDIAGMEENAFHLIYAVQTGNAVLDGFIIEGASTYTDESEEPEEVLDDYIFINEIYTSPALGSGATFLLSSVTLSHITLRNNLSLSGGGVVSILSDVLIHNSSVYNNVSDFFGGGITAFYSDVDIINVTVTENFCYSIGAGILSVNGYNKISNTISYDNFLFNGPPVDFLSDNEDSEISNSLIGGSGGSGVDWETYLGIDAGGNLDEDPVFKDVVAKDFSLTACSRAINGGDNGFYSGSDSPNLSLVTKDLAGNERFYSELIDMGAYEFQSDPSSGTPTLAGDGKESYYTFTDNTPHTFMAQNGICEVELLTLEPDALAGEVYAAVWVDTEVMSFNGAFYVQRHFDIEPSEDAETATAKVTLYFTQEEFNAFNLLMDAEEEYLPTGNVLDGNEDERIENLRIYQFHGPTCYCSSDPSSYTGGRTAITPDEVIWNSEKNRWEVTFYADGFSGFFAGTASQSPLPVRLVSFDGKLTDDKKVRLDWNVAEQENIQAYVVEYSANGKNFNDIGMKMANTLSDAKYSYTDSVARSVSQAYYRLRIMEMDGKKAYSRMVAVKLPDTGKMVVYPIPAKNEVWIDWRQSDVNFAEFIDVNGKVLKRIQKLEALQQIDISGLPKGVFLMRGSGHVTMKLVKE